MAKNQQMVQQETITKTLTDKEKLFAELAAENYYASDTKPNYQLAIEAGYAEGSARQRAYENLNSDKISAFHSKLRPENAPSTPSISFIITQTLHQPLKIHDLGLLTVIRKERDAAILMV